MCVCVTKYVEVKRLKEENRDVRSLSPSPLSPLCASLYLYFFPFLSHPSLISHALLPLLLGLCALSSVCVSVFLHQCTSLCCCLVVF